jgi:hypothetical protein
LLSLGASYRTQNFIVTAPTPHFAQQVAMAAENFRRDLALEWLGRELPPWSQPCPIRVDVGPNKGAGGTTRFSFYEGRPTDWTMSIQGSSERILDSVLPHEITHTIFATHFGRPLPRWADEGACTTVEHEIEKQKQHRMLYEFLTTGRGIAFNQMFAMTEYPLDVHPLYAQGYSLARFLIQQGGKQKFVEYVGDGMRWNNWTRATQIHYSIASLSNLQVSWLEWVRRGCPEIAAPTQPVLASQTEDSPIQLVSLQQPSQQQPSQQQPSQQQPSQQQPSKQQALQPAGRAGSSPLPHALPQAAPTSTGWYARVRDEAHSSRNSAQSATTTPASVSRDVSSPALQSPRPDAVMVQGAASDPRRTEAATALHQAVSQALSRGAPVESPQVVTRPQPMERARQQVIKW